MAQKTIYICDICGSTENVKEFSLVVDSQYNGVETEDVIERLDLCDKHYSKALVFAVCLLSTEQKKEVMNQLNALIWTIS